MDHVVFIHHLSMDTWVVSTFWLSWIMLLWTQVYKYLFESLLSIILGMHLGVELLGHVVILCLTFWGTARLFSTGAAPFSIPTSRAWWFWFLPILGNSGYFLGFLFVCLFFGFFYRCPNECEVVSPCGFDWHFPDDKWCQTSFQALLGHLCNFFVEKSTQVLCPCLHWISLTCSWTSYMCSRATSSPCLASIHVVSARCVKVVTVAIDHFPCCDPSRKLSCLRSTGFRVRVSGLGPSQPALWVIAFGHLQVEKSI